MIKYSYNIDYYVGNTTASSGFETEKEMFDYAVWLDNHNILVKDAKRVTYRIIDRIAEAIRIEQYEFGKPSILVWELEEA